MSPCSIITYPEALGYPANKDYITINRGSQDRNLWSRHNRWFHIDVIEKSIRNKWTSASSGSVEFKLELSVHYRI